MPLATQGSNTDSNSLPSEDLASPSSSCSSQSLTSHKWSHKKFGCRKRTPVQPELPASCQRHRAAVQSPSPSVPLAPVRVTRPSPHREEKKKKRRESDAKWRSNLSVCFKHLETKVVKARNCFKTRLSKEMIVQKTVQKVQYLEAVFMLLNQADRQSKKCEFSPLKGHHNLQAVRREFAHRFYYRNRQKRTILLASPKPTGKGTRLVTDTAVGKPEPKPVLQEGVVPEHGKTPSSSEQLVPPSVTTTASRVTGKNPIRSAAWQDRAVPSTPTRSLICEEQDLPDNKSSRTPKLTSRKATRDCCGGDIPQSNVMTSSGKGGPYMAAQTPTHSPARNPGCAVPVTPSLYSPDKTPAWSPTEITASSVRPVKYHNPDHSFASSPARGHIRADPSSLSYNQAARSPTESPAQHLTTGHEEAVPHWPSYWSPAKSPAQSPATRRGIADLHRVPYWSPPRTPAKNPAAGRRSAAQNRPPNWSPATVSAGSPAKSNGSAVGYRPLYRSPAHRPATHGITDHHGPQYKSPVSTPTSSPARSRDTPYIPPLLSDLVMHSPSKRYKIVGGSIFSLGDAEPGTWVSSSQTDLDSSLGRVTPDLTCQEEIPTWKEDESSQKLTPYSTPRSVRFPRTSQPPSVPPKKCLSTWSAKFVNDVRQFHEGLVPKQTKSKRCKRLLYDGEYERTGGDVQIKKGKANTVLAEISDLNKKEPRRKYHKRATAARIRPWDPVTSKVCSPVCGVTRQRTYRRKSKTPTSSTASSAEPSPHRRPNAAPRVHDKMGNSKLPKTRNIIRGGPRIIIEEDNKWDVESGVEDILDVEEVDLDWPKEHFCKATHNGQSFPDKSSSVDQDSSQGSLLLSEIPQLPDDIITPLLMCGESSQCFLDDADLEKTLQPEKYPPAATDNHLKTTKYDDEIVLTILALEEESRTSSSTRSSPDSIDNLHANPASATTLANPTSDTTSAENDIVDVMEVMTPSQGGFPDHLQGALLEAYRLMSAETGNVGCPPTVILSPLRMSRLSLDGQSSPNKTSFYLISPVKQEREEIHLKLSAEETECLQNETVEDEITESMARFASSALSKQSHNACYQQPVKREDRDPEAFETDYGDGEKAYRGATQALLNGQIVCKAAGCLKISSYRPQSTLICVDSGTPSKNQPQLPYSVPCMATTAIEFCNKDQRNSCPTSDTDFPASYTSAAPYLSPLSATTLSSPQEYMSIGTLSQSTADMLFSSGLPEEAHRLPQHSQLISKQAEWDWTDPPDINLEADESLDELMGDDLLARYYHTYDCLSMDGAGSGRDGEGLIEVPDWPAETNVAGQSSEDDFLSSSATSFSSSMATSSSSQDTATTDSLQSVEFQVVPSLSADDDEAAVGPAIRADEMAGDQFGFQGEEVKYEVGGSPEKSLQIFHHWLLNQ